MPQAHVPEEANNGTLIILSTLLQVQPHFYAFWQS